jgi:UDP-N-acetylmuramate: L-alanyl-gamma-D-glutamyl-meso-diaminopimelate ligase
MSCTRPELPKHVHLIGICGRGMAGLADSLHKLGIRVTGSDQETFDGRMEWLRSRGIQVREGFAAAALDDRPDAVIAGRSWGRGHPEVERVLEERLRYYSMPGFISEFFLHGARNLVVAGSKGKTTTTSMAAWIMMQAGRDPGFLIGGRPFDFEGSAKFGSHEMHVIEGDDYSSLWWDDNPKFCYYRPEAAILTNILDDHPDQHGGGTSAIRHFSCLVNQIPRSGLLVTGSEDEPVWKVSSNAYCPVLRAGFDEGADVIIRQCAQTADGIAFQIEGTSFRLPLLGRVNMLNAAMAAVCARHFGVSFSESAAALEEFHGVRGRLECVGEANGIICYSDMGYLPQCIDSALEALRKRYPDRRLVFMFQPHIVEGIPQSHPAMAQAACRADLSLLMDVYRPKTYTAVNPGFSDDMCRQVTETGGTAVRIGPIETAMESALPHLRPGDVVLAVTHPKHAEKVRGMVEVLAQTASCES